MTITISTIASIRANTITTAISITLTTTISITITVTVTNYLLQLQLLLLLLFSDGARLLNAGLHLGIPRIAILSKNSEEVLKNTRIITIMAISKLLSTLLRALFPVISEILTVS